MGDGNARCPLAGGHVEYTLKDSPPDALLDPQLPMKAGGFRNTSSGQAGEQEVNL